MYRNHLKPVPPQVTNDRLVDVAYPDQTDPLRLGSIGGIQPQHQDIALQESDGVSGRGEHLRVCLGRSAFTH